MKVCPLCGKENRSDSWLCPCGYEFESSGPQTRPEAPRKVRRRTHKANPLYSTIWLSLLAFHWIVLAVAGLWFLRRYRAITFADIAVAAVSILLALFYLWVARGVTKRRSEMWEIALVCAGLGLLGFPIGTMLSLALFANLLAARDQFNK